MLGEVTYDRDRRRIRSIAIGVELDRDRKFRAVASAAEQRKARSHRAHSRCLRKLVAMPAVLIGESLRDQQVDRLTDEFVDFVPKQLLCARICVEDSCAASAALGDDEQRVRQQIEDVHPALRHICARREDRRGGSDE